MMTAVSTPGASSGPSTSTTRPSAGRVAVGHSMICAVTISPCAAVLAWPEGTCMSMTQPPIEGHHESPALLIDVVAADDPLRTALEDADNAAFGAIGVSARSTRTTTRSPCMA